MSSLKGNIILNYINTISGLIFPIITFPYAARVMLPEGIGVVNFQNSIVGYIILLTSLGIPLYGVREIAKCRSDRELRDRTAVEILILSVLLCVFGYAVVWLLGVYVPRIHEEATLFYILSLSIIFTGIGAQWFYQGIEDFFFITVRGLIVRILFAVCLFVFVRHKDDLLIYGSLIVGSTVGNYLINFIHLRKYLQLAAIKWNQLNVTRHLIPACHAFLFIVITSIYIQLNTIMLGFMADDRSVGIFTAGNKLTHILVVIATSLGTVMLPRCSHLINEGRIDDFNNIIRKAYHFLMFTAVPVTAGVMLLATPITLCFCGTDYDESILVVLYTAPTILFIGITNIIGIQILYPYGKMNLVIISTLVAAVLNVVLNLLLIPPFGATGAAISTFISEFAVLVVQVRLGKGYIPFVFIDKQVAGYLQATLVMSIGVYLCLAFENVWLQALVGASVGTILYLSFLMVRKDAILTEMLSMLLKRVHRKNEME